MSESILSIIEDLNEMLLLKQREMEWLNRRILYLENEMYTQCSHDWEDFKCKNCNLYKR